MPQLSGPLTPKGLKTFADVDTPDLYSNPGGLTEVLNMIDARLVVITIADVVVPAGGVATIDFQNIAQTYKALRLVARLRLDSGASGDALLRFNNDAGANYDHAVDSAAATASALPRIAYTTVPGTSAPAGAFSSFDILIPDYASVVSAIKIAVGVQARPWHYDGVNAHGNSVASVDWRNAAAINRVTLVPGAGNWTQDSHATLYGIA